MRTSTLVMLASVGIVGATAAPAQQATEVPVEQVRYGDLDLNSAAGKRELARRIGGATESVCGSYAGLREDVSIMAIDECRRSARAQSESQVAAIIRSKEVRSASR